MKYKLPPLPEAIVKIGHGNSTWNKYNGAQMQAYAIAAIEAQGEPDGWRDLLKAIEWGAGGYNRFGDSENWCPYCESWQSDGHASNCRISAMLASSPLAPQQKPLLFSEIWDNDAIMEVNADARLPFEMIARFVRAVEAAHGIGEKK